MDIGIQKLSEILLEMANVSETSVATAIEEYSHGSKAPPNQFRQWSDHIRNLHEDVTELAIDLIAKYQPVASDLRFIKASMEISYGFSRYGRYAYDIAQVLETFGDLTKCDHETVELTAKVTKEMIRMSIDALSTRDVDLASKIAKMDDFVDDKYREYVKRATNSGSTEELKCILSATLILRYLERIADHSSYIGESVNYIVTGQKGYPKEK